MLWRVDKMIEIRYAGAVVGRSSIIRELDTRGLFLGMTEPLPLGTAVDLKIDEQIVPGRVEQVSESQELARAGMRIRFSRPESAQLFGTPVEAPPEAAPPLWFSTQPAAHESRTLNGEAAGVTLPMPASSATSGPRRIVVDASTEKGLAGSAGDPEGSPPDANGAGGPGLEAGIDEPTDTRIPAPDPAALGGVGGGRKNRRNRRR
jgi:hypothetical protein